MDNSEKILTIAYWDLEKRLTSSQKINFENKVNLLGNTEFITFTKLEELSNTNVDLLIASADHVEDADLEGFIVSLSKRIERLGAIWVPALIFSEASYEVLHQFMKNIVQDNWYFDFIHPDHLDSLPIRAANLLKIHDHMRELKNYELKLADLESKVTTLEQKV